MDEDARFGLLVEALRENVGDAFDLLALSRQEEALDEQPERLIRQHMSANVSKCQKMSANVSKYQEMPANVSKRQQTSVIRSTTGFLPGGGNSR